MERLFDASTRRGEQVPRELVVVHYRARFVALEQEVERWRLVAEKSSRQDQQSIVRSQNRLRADLSAVEAKMKVIEAADLDGWRALRQGLQRALSGPAFCRFFQVVIASNLIEITSVPRLTAPCRSFGDGHVPGLAFASAPSAPCTCTAIPFAAHEAAAFARAVRRSCGTAARLPGVPRSLPPIGVDSPTVRPCIAGSCSPLRR